MNATLVLSIGETVEEVTDSGFLGTTPTLSCSSLGDDALVQVYPDGIRHIRSDRRVNEWKAPGKKSITKCAVNQRQVVITLSGRELVYFEMDAVSIFIFLFWCLILNTFLGVISYKETQKLLECKLLPRIYSKPPPLMTITWKRTIVLRHYVSCSADPKPLTQPTPFPIQLS